VVNSQADHGPSILRGPLQAVLPEPAPPALPVHVLDLPRAQGLERPVRVASADLHVPAALRRPLENLRHVRRAPLREAVADARSIQRPKKAP